MALSDGSVRVQDLRTSQAVAILRKTGGAHLTSLRCVILTTWFTVSASNHCPSCSFNWSRRQAMMTNRVFSSSCALCQARPLGQRVGVLRWQWRVHAVGHEELVHPSDATR